MKAKLLADAALVCVGVTSVTNVASAATFAYSGYSVTDSQGLVITSPQ